VLASASSDLVVGSGTPVSGQRTRGRRKKRGKLVSVGDHSEPLKEDESSPLKLSSAQSSNSPSSSSSPAVWNKKAGVPRAVEPPRRGLERDGTGWIRIVAAGGA